MPERASKSIIPASLSKNKWVSTILSLIVGLGLGTTLGREVLESAGVPESCVQALQRADRALDTGTAVADDGKAALVAVRAVDIPEAVDLLRSAKTGADQLIELVQRFNDARTSCNTDRK